MAKKGANSETSTGKIFVIAGAEKEVKAPKPLKQYLREMYDYRMKRGEKFDTESESLGYARELEENYLQTYFKGDTDKYIDFIKKQVFPIDNGKKEIGFREEEDKIRFYEKEIKQGGKGKAATGKPKSEEREAPCSRIIKDIEFGRWLYDNVEEELDAGMSIVPLTKGKLSKKVTAYKIYSKKIDDKTYYQITDDYLSNLRKRYDKYLGNEKEGYSEEDGIKDVEEINDDNAQEGKTAASAADGKSPEDDSRSKKIKETVEEVIKGLAAAENKGEAENK